MKTCSVLVRFPGNPFSFNALLPDIHAASAAGALLEEGHDTQVWDLGTLDTMERLFPARYRGVLERIADPMMEGGMPSAGAVLQTVVQRGSLDRAFASRCEKLCAELAETLAGQRGLHFVGFSLTAAEDAAVAVRVARRLREERPEALLVVFGPYAEAFAAAEDVESRGAFDCYVVADPEFVLPRWAGVLGNRVAWASVANLAYAVGARLHWTAKRRAVESEDPPLPAYHCEAYPALAGMHKIKLFTLADSQGCACRCHACALPDSELGFRRTSPDRVREAMVEAGLEHGARAFHVAGPGTTGAHARAVAIAISGGGLDVAYSRSLSIGLTDPSVFPLLEGSGCRAVWFRVDTGSQMLLENHYGRGIEVSHVERVLRAAKGAGLFTGARFTYPCPGDDRHTEAETIRLVERTRLDAVHVALPEVVYRSTWHRHPELFGFGREASLGDGRAIAGRLRFPMPKYLEPLPYAVGRLGKGQVLAGNEALSLELARRDVTTCFPEAFFLVARLGQQAGKERALALRAQHHFMTGAVSSIAALASRFNQAACVPAYANALRRTVRLRLAAGD